MPGLGSLGLGHRLEELFATGLLVLSQLPPSFQFELVVCSLLGTAEVWFRFIAA